MTVEEMLALPGATGAREHFREWRGGCTCHLCTLLVNVEYAEARQPVSEEFDQLSLQAEAIQGVREYLGALVSALVADGFTDEQARAMTVRVFVSSTESA